MVSLQWARLWCLLNTGQPFSSKWLASFYLFFNLKTHRHSPGTGIESPNGFIDVHWRRRKLFTSRVEPSEELAAKMTKMMKETRVCKRKFAARAPLSLTLAWLRAKLIPLIAIEPVAAFIFERPRLSTVPADTRHLACARRVTRWAAERMVGEQRASCTLLLANVTNDINARAGRASARLEIT